MADVEVDRDGPVMVVRLNRPERRNAIGGAVLRLLLEAFREASADDAIRAVVTVGNGGMFCVGAEVSALGAATEQAETTSTGANPPDRGDSDSGLAPLSPSSTVIDTFGTPGRWASEMLTLDKPTIAAIEGAAAGGGLCLACLHDFRVASPAAKFVAGFTALGLTTEMGLSYLLPKIVGLQAARRILLTNNAVRGEEAYRIGLADEIADAPLDAALAMAHTIAKLPPLGLRVTKHLIRPTRHASYEDALTEEYRAQRTLFATGDHREAIAAFNERRVGEFVGR
jgi:2-(1,2-epoxy-1,2-dihydrophenyl)acetyl-CoA isomerase